MTCDCCGKEGVTNVNLWACAYQCRIINLGDSSDTNGYAYFCDDCYDRTAHGCWDRLETKKTYQVEHGKETREKRRTEAHEEGNNRYDSRQDFNVRIGKHVNRLISDVMKLKEHHLRYCDMNERSRNAPAGRRVKAEMDNLFKDAHEMHVLIPQEYAEGKQREKDEAHFQMEWGDVNMPEDLPKLDTVIDMDQCIDCLLYTSPSPRDATLSRMPSSA